MCDLFCKFYCVFIDFSGDISIRNTIILQEQETKLFIASNKLTTKDEKVVCYYLVMFATVFLQITCCITYTRLIFFILMFTNVFLIITICTTLTNKLLLLLLFTTLEFTVLVNLAAKSGATLLSGDLLSNKCNIIDYFLQLIVLFLSLVFYFAKKVVCNRFCTRVF